MPDTAAYPYSTTTKNEGSSVKGVFPLYWQAKEELAHVTIELTPDQQDQRAHDRDVVKAIDEYYAPHRERWRSNGALFNLVQAGSDDVTSNWYLGWARILINHSMSMLTAAVPKADFEPVGHQDVKMRILVNSLVEHLINKCNWAAHQRLWIEDLHTFGNGVTESYSELPMRNRKYEDQNGNVIQKIVRDFRHPKVGIRRRSPFRCMRSHFISDPDDVPVSLRIEEGTWNTFAIRYGNAKLEDGSKKYDTDQIPAGSHYRIVHFYDEQENCYRMYCVTYGNKPEATQMVYAYQPPLYELGYPIYDKPLARYKVRSGDKFLMGGANVPGLSPLAFAIFDDQLDNDYETYSICGMGIPQIIEGPESIMHGLVNMAIDNERLLNTVPVSYEPLTPDSPSALDLDVRTMYSGLLIDGKVTPQPLGQKGAGANQPLWEWLKFLIYQLSGINPEPLTGDQLHTAYQSGLLIRQMNMRAKSRISAWENGPLKRAWTVLGANALSECTVEEWEEITEDDAKYIQELVKSNKMSEEDFMQETVNGKTAYKKAHRIMIPVKGHKFAEDFTGKNKKRTLNANDVNNTLIEDATMQGSTSYVPATSTYLLPSGSIESILEYQVRVSGSGMLTDLKTQDMESAKEVLSTAVQLAQVIPDIDFKKQLTKIGEIAGFSEEDMFKSPANQSTLAKKFKDAAQAATDKVNAAGQQGQINPQTAPGQTQQAIQQGKVFNAPTAEAAGLFPENNQLNGPSEIASKLAQGLT